MIHRPFVLTSPLGEPIRGDLRLPDGAGPFPVVVVCHGFKGFKDWGFHPWLGERLAGAGLAAAHFDFSRNGVRGDVPDITDLDAFRRNTLSIELGDLATVLDSLATAFPGAPLDAARVGLLGHSRGGGTTIIAASERPDVRALVTFSAVSTFERISGDDVLARWRRTGVHEVLNARTGQMLPLGVELLEDVEANRGRLDVLSAARRVPAPWRIVHGTADETVPFEEGRALLAAATGAVSDLVPVEGGSHTFGAVHPWAGPTPHLEEAARAAIDWFERHLTGPLAG